MLKYYGQYLSEAWRRYPLLGLIGWLLVANPISEEKFSIFSLQIYPNLFEVKTQMVTNHFIIIYYNKIILSMK
jgi:hypothetical protein